MTEKIDNKVILLEHSCIEYVENPREAGDAQWRICKNGYTSWRFASFVNKEQLDCLAETLGFTYELVEETSTSFGKYQRYTMDKNIVEPLGYGGFWKLADLPDGVKPIKALSNGSIVTCYYLTMDDRIELYRPNPNAKEVYKPLDINEHIAHQRIYGTY